MKIREKKKHKNLQFRLRFSRPFHFFRYLSSKKKKKCQLLFSRRRSKERVIGEHSEKGIPATSLQPGAISFSRNPEGKSPPQRKDSFFHRCAALVLLQEFFLFFLFLFFLFFFPLIFHFPFETQPDFQLTSLLSAKSRLDFPIL